MTINHTETSQSITTKTGLGVAEGITGSTDTVLDVATLTSLTDREFFAITGDINEAHRAAKEAFEASQRNLAHLLTEQVARLVHRLHPDASLLNVRSVADFHSLDNGDQDPNCAGHNHRLVPFEVVNHDGVVIAGFEPMSPAYFLLERLSPLIGAQDQTLDVTTRTWFYDYA